MEGDYLPIQQKIKDSVESRLLCNTFVNKRIRLMYDLSVSK